MSTSTTSATQPTPSGGLNSNSMLGSKLSIISTVQMRYEGILSEVDPVQKTMRLKNVRNCGTEGRRDGVNEIQESEQEIQEVLFKIEHIKDFKIIEQPNTVLLDPSIVQSSTAKTVQEQPKPQVNNQQPPRFEETKTLQRPETQQHNTRANNSNQDPFYSDFQPQQYQQRGEGKQHYGNNQRGGGGGNYNQRGNRGGNYQRGGGSGGYHNQQRGPVGELQENPNAQLKESLKETFNFDQHHLSDPTASTTTPEQESEQLVQEQTSKETTTPVQTGSSGFDGFFDSISNSTQATKADAMEGGYQPRMADVRRKDVETFGPSAGQSQGGYNKRGGGYGGGGNNQGYQNNYRGGGGGYTNNYRGNGNNYYQDSGNSYRGGGRGGQGYYDNSQRGGSGYQNNYNNNNNYRGNNNNNFRGGRGGYHQGHNSGGIEEGSNNEWQSGYNQNYRGGRGGRGGYQGNNNYQNQQYDQRPPGTAPSGGQRYERGGGFQKRGGYHQGGPQQQWQYVKPNEGAETSDQK